MPNDSSVAVEMVEAMADECFCGGPMQDYAGEQLVVCTECCRPCSEAAANEALWCRHMDDLAFGMDDAREGGFSWLDQFMV